MISTLMHLRMQASTLSNKRSVCDNSTFGTAKNAKKDKVESEIHGIACCEDH